MKCCCYETEKDFTFCVHDVENTQLEDIIQHMAFIKNNNKFLMAYPQHEFSNQNEKELVNKNFLRLGQEMFESLLLGFDWEKPLELLTQKFNENKIEWYIIGSLCDAVRGVDVKPFDMDIVIHTKDYYKAKDICYSNFSDSIVFPFTDNQGRFAMRFFGRMFLTGALVEIAAHEKWNIESRLLQYEKTSWNGYEVYLVSLQQRYQIEIARNREDRIKAIKEYINKNDIRLPIA
jgi:hypothetical protein